MAAWSCRAWRSTRRRGNPRCRGPQALLRTPRHGYWSRSPALPLCAETSASQTAACSMVVAGERFRRLDRRSPHDPNGDEVITRSPPAGRSLCHGCNRPRGGGRDHAPPSPRFAGAWSAFSRCSRRCLRKAGVCAPAGTTWLGVRRQRLVLQRKPGARGLPSVCWSSAGGQRPLGVRSCLQRLPIIEAESSRVALGRMSAGKSAVRCDCVRPVSVRIRVRVDRAPLAVRVCLRA